MSKARLLGLVLVLLGLGLSAPASEACTPYVVGNTACPNGDPIDGVDVTIFRHATTTFPACDAASYSDMTEPPDGRFDTCVHCDSDLTPEGNAFAPLLGGVLCPGCRVGLPGRPLSAKAFKLLRFMQTAPYGDVARVRIDEALGREIEAHLREVVQSALDQEVRAAGFVEAVRATRPLPTESSP
jgi:hypothetical protein